MKKAGIYIHFPFCKSRCSYCDFSTSAGMDDLMREYLDCLQIEVNSMGQALAEEIHVPTIYLGGGTPSYLPENYIQEAIQKVRTTFRVDKNVEISMEANPADITVVKAEAWKAVGINRLSLGMQSAQNTELELLGRRHQFDDVQKAFRILRDTGFDNLNLDLMFGLPGQELRTWQDSLEKAIALRPEHFSLYSLTVEQGTPLEKDIRNGNLPAPDEDLGADMYALAMDFLEEKGFQQYEISNWALKEPDFDHRCQHNLIYWRNDDYLGFGASAHSHFKNLRWANKHGSKDYLRTFQTQEHGKEFPLIWMQAFNPQSMQEEMSDTSMMGLRLTQEGIIDTDFEKKFGVLFSQTYHKEISKLVKMDLLEVLEQGEKHIRLTKKGRFVGNQVFYHFVQG